MTPHANDETAPGASKGAPELSEIESKAVRGQKLPQPPTFDDPHEERKYLKGRLALAFRIFHKLGYEVGVSGHITIRDPVDPSSFWVNPLGVSWKLLRASDLIRVSKDGQVVDGGEIRLLNTAAFMIHSAVHEARPEINAVAHSHSPYGRAFSTLGRTLDITTQDSCAFYEDIALYSNFGGVVLDAEEGEHIVKALGKKRAAILQNHGLLMCAESLEGCVYWYELLENLCHGQMLADAAAAGRGHTTIKISQAEAEATAQLARTEMAGRIMGKPKFDLMEHESGVEYKM